MPRALACLDDVVAATGGDAYARLPRDRGASPLVALAASSGAPAAAWVRRGALDPGETRAYLEAVGPAAEVPALVAAALVPLVGRSRATLPVAALPLLGHAGVGFREAVRWDFRWTGTPPPAAGAPVAWLPASAAPEVAALLDAQAPSSSARPGGPGVRRWAGLRDGAGRLLAVAADTSQDGSEVGVFASVAVDAAARRHCLGAAVVRWLVRELLAEGRALVACGAYADNAAGRALYDALGFEEHRFADGVARLLHPPR